MQWEIDDCAWTTQRWHEGPYTGVVFNFHGLGAPGVRVEMEWQEWEWTKAGALVVFPYYGPWSWMNRTARAFCDQLVEKIYTKYKLADNVPLIMTGGSMGGHAALTYTRYAKRPVAACAARSPVCDLKVHYGERVDLPRTILNAFMGCSEDLESLIAETSPMAQVAQMPRIPYWFAHGTADKSVNKELHSDALVAGLRARGIDVEYLVMPDVGHETPPQWRIQEIAWIKKHLLKR